MNKRVLIEDKLIYFTGVYSNEVNLGYFKTLKETIEWGQDEIMMFGKRTKVPRLTSWYADPNVKYSYSGLELIPRQWTPELIELKSLAEKLSNHSFNSVLLNFYRGGADSMGWHSDDEKELGTNPIIASITFGYPRRFLIRERMDFKNKKEIELEDGSVLVMRGDFQETYQHSIPKTARKVGERLNLTFRTIR
ncbi:MAG: alpha-ketoglutarate-dependent dioxygenase AlkB [Ignavibacteriae bacterium HGW-Ignavibacteriae-4]|jgi:alkylated DNA repair dioxygenase AlkB|nr:MAG: alpha-ketoglutarate-dependent dioxygenase AlkB [Ignavibacteriae bacterium HGW-Ignavibacteriae-4]